MRLIFAKLMLTKDNVLVLDEPTNHLDLESIVALGDALEKYEGTAFVVTHDRDLIEQFATRLWAFTAEGLVDFRGTYDEFLEKTGQGGGRAPGRARRAARGAEGTEMDFLDTARRLEAIQAEVVRDLASDSEPIAGGWMAANGPGSYLNKAVGMGFDAEPSPDDVERVERFFSVRGIEPRIELTPFAPTDFLRRIAERGFVLQEFEHTLVLPVSEGLAGLEERLPAGRHPEVADRAARPEQRGPGPHLRRDQRQRLPSGRRTDPGDVSGDGHQGRAGLRPSRLPGLRGRAGGRSGRLVVPSGRDVALRHLGASCVPPARNPAGAHRRAARTGARRCEAELASITSHPGIPTERNAARLGFQLAFARSVLVKRGPGLVPSP